MRLVGTDGRDATPRLARARGVLALLATAQQHRATRKQLIDKLWSTRDEPQGADSLRQALRSIRVAAGPDVLNADAGWVELAEGTVMPVLEPEENHGEVPEFADDLNIKDPAFEEWIADRRKYFANAWRHFSRLQGIRSIRKLPVFGQGPDESTRPHIVIGDCQASSTDLVLLGDTVVREAALGAAELVHGVVVDNLVSSGQIGNPNALFIGSQIASISGRLIVQVRISSTERPDLQWLRSFSGESGRAEGLLNEARDALFVALVNTCSKLSEQIDPGLPALADIFSFERDRLWKADKLLSERHDVEPDAAFLAFRAYLRHTLVLERLEPDAAKLMEEARHFGRSAVDLSPHHPLVLSLVSLVAGLEGNDEFAIELATKATAARPGNPLIRHCLSVAWSFIGEHQKAHDEALKSAQIWADGVPPAILHLRKAYTSIGLGDREAALTAARLATQISPDFRAAHRVVAALEYTLGHEDRAEKSLLDLHRLEPDFSLDLMKSNSYPVDSLRKAGLLQVTKSKLL